MARLLERRAYKRSKSVAFALAVMLASELQPLQHVLAADVEVLHPVTDVCSVLSEQDASSIFGSPALPQTADPTSQCVWTPATPTDKGVAAILIFIEWPGPSEITRRTQQPSFGIPARASQRVNDLPAAAVWLEPTDTEYSKHVLVVLSGSMQMSVYVTGTWSDEERATASELATALKVARDALFSLP
jgi:hypothetical protein